MAASVTATLTLSYGDAAVQGAVLSRIPLSFTLAYTEETSKTAHVPASSTDFAITLDTVSAPKFLLVRTLDFDVECKLGDGVDTVPTALAAASGWIMFCNPAGQSVNTILVTTPASPVAGARVQVIAFE